MWIQQQLARTGRTQVELADAIGLTPVQVNKIIKGTRRVQVSEAEMIRDFFGDDPSGQADDDQDAMIPVYDIEASAGNGTLAGYEAAAYSLAFPPDYLRSITTSNPKYLQIISVHGDSMEPVLKNNDIVMLDRSKTNVVYDGMFVVRHVDVLKVKRLRLSTDRRTITLISVNAAVYPPEDWPVDDVEVLGRVMWYGRKT